jgi:DNA invertase Pin-like site-specific DNA recombinase
MSETLTIATGLVERVVNPGQIRAVAYLRVSTEEQAKGYGIAYTAKKVLKYFEKKEYAHVGTFADEGLSGSLEAHERPGLKRLMTLARQTPRPFDLVGVNEGRVIGRTGRAFWRWVWELEDLGVYVAVAKKDYDNSTPSGRGQMRKDADYAEEERELIRERTNGGRQEKAEEGGWPGGRTPYGWMIENKGQKGASKAARDPHEWGVLHRMLELAVVHHRNAEGIAATLNAEGTLTREGKRWSNKNVLNKLKSEAVQQAQVTFRKESRSLKDRDGNLLYGATVTIPLVPAFTAVELASLNAALTQFSVVRKKDGTPSYPLSKRIVGECGRHYTGFVRPRGGRAYRCAGKQQAYAGAGICSCSQVGADDLEQAAWTKICQLLGDAEQLRRLAEERAGLAAANKVNHAERLEKLDQQIEEQTDAIDATMAVAARQAAKRGLKGPAAEEAIERVVSPLNQELAELEKQRAEVADWQAETERAEQRARDLQELARAASKRLDNLSEPKRARLISLLDVQVTLTSAVPRPCRGRKAGLPSFEVTGRIEPRLVTEHLAERSRGETWPHVPSGVIQFRMRVAASLTSEDARSLVDRRAA